MNTPTLQQRIESANKQGRLARIPFITAGFPDESRFFEALRELDEHGADVIEIGVPFSDPVADGPVVEEASRIVLENGVSLAWIMERLCALPHRLKAGLVLMGYYNPFLQYGLEKLVQDMRTAGVQGLIIPDLPLEEDGLIREKLSAAGMDLISLVGPNTSEERMREYAAKATGYVYVVSVMGVTGVRKDLPPEVEETLARAKRAFPLPVALGFGIHSPAQVSAIRNRPQAVVFGSALLRHLESGGSAKEFMEPWEKAAD